ncbi:MAG: hypothetical protein II323_06775 [Tidjanibacter sp.]|nr:hypothetical protein [Tidjanibacter sp.]
MKVSTLLTHLAAAIVGAAVAIATAPHKLPAPTLPTFPTLPTLSAPLPEPTSRGALSVPVLRMSRGEVEEFRSAEVAALRSRGTSLRRTLALSTTHALLQLDTTLLASTAADPATPSVEPSNSQDSTCLTPILSDSLCRVQWRDSWVSLEVEMVREGAHIRLTSSDTLRQRLFRVPYEWWIFRWGTKAVRQEISCSNPHTRLVYSEYIRIER